MNNIKDYYLIIENVIDLPTPKRNMIMDMYRDMIHRMGDPSCKDMVKSYFNSLEMGGFIANRLEVERRSKLDKLTND